ncbi:cytochrome P450 [Myxozyma melibiosi]|uniref:Cytochrome P450 n=1 Tax=Myxozyma melibiosi TaxID=54550 RepID=A0ABR1F7C9_9ASCO
MNTLALIFRVLPVIQLLSELWIVYSFLNVVWKVTAHLLIRALATAIFLYLCPSVRVVFYNAVYFPLLSKARAVPSPSTGRNIFHGHYSDGKSIVDGVTSMAYAREALPRARLLRVSASFYPSARPWEVILPVSRDSVHQVLVSRAESFVRSISAYSILARIFGKGVLTTDSASAHDMMRSSLLPAFTQHNVVRLVPGFLEHTSKLIVSIENKLDHSNPTTSMHLEQPITRSLTDSTCQALVGDNFNLLEHPESMTATAFQRLLLGTAPARVIFHCTLKFTKWRDHDIVNDFVREAVNAKIALHNSKQKYEDASGSDGQHRNANIMSFLLEHDAPAWTADSFLEQFYSLLVMQSDTIGGVRRTLWYLTLYPEIQSRLRDEIRSTFPEGAASITSASDLTSLRFLDCVLKESLRLAPPRRNAVFRKAVKDVHIDGYRIPKGATVYVDAYMLNRLPSVWGPDASEFYPERWQQKESNTDTFTDEQNLMTFSKGPFSCIGEQVALLQMKAFLAGLVGTFSFESPEEDPMADKDNVYSAEKLKALLVARVPGW